MAAFDQKAIRKRVNALLQDDANFITSDERDEAITQGVEQVNHDRPFVTVKDITGDTTQDYDIEGIGFQKSFSDMREVEFPADENPPLFIDRIDDWIVYEDPSKSSGAQQRLRLFTVTPKTTEKIRVTFTGLYSVTLTSSNLNQTTFLAVVYKSLVFLYRALAGRFSQTTDPTISADTVDYGGRSQNFLFLATRWEDQYKQIVGFGEEEIRAAQALDEADVIFSHGEDFIFHPSSIR